MSLFYHYVYSIVFSTGHIYYGLRSCKHPVTPELDTTYMGSPVTFKEYWQNPEITKTKHILATFSTREEAADAEVELIKRQWELDKSKSLNGSICGTLWNAVGRKHSKKTKDKMSKPFFLISPEGKMVEGRNLNTLAEKIGLKHATGLSMVLNGKSNHCHGWTANFYNHLVWKYYGDFKKVLPPIDLKHPEHGIVRCYGRSKFAKKYGINSTNVCQIINGQAVCIKGWTLADFKNPTPEYILKRRKILKANIHLTDKEIVNLIQVIEPETLTGSLFSWVGSARKKYNAGKLDTSIYYFSS